MTQLNFLRFDELTARELNITQSPKKNGSAQIDSQLYIEELGIEIIDKPH